MNYRTRVQIERLEYPHVSPLKFEMFRYSSLFFIIFLLGANCVAQDTISRFSIRDFSFELKGGLIYQGEDWGAIDVPPYLREQNPATPYYTGDEPLIHGASYLDAGTRFQLDGFSLHAQLIAEHRGQSYGVYTLQAIDVYPKLLAGIDTSFSILGHRLGLAVSGGNYDDIRLQEGLTMYNLDIQGSRWSISFDKLSFTYQKLADLQYWIDLNQNDGNNYSIKLDSAPLPLNFAITAEFSNSDPTGVIPYYSSAVGRDIADIENVSNSFSLRLMHTSGVAAYGEYGVRNLGGADNNAYLMGASYSLATNRISLNTHAEYRYYGALFNLGFYEPSQNYFDSSTNTYYSNSMSRYKLGNSYLYPLELYDRPFSQWAVFTDYQGLNVSGLTFYADLKVPIYSGLFFKGLLDWNKITAQGQAPFIYPFYVWGFGWQPFAGVSFLYSFTNRTMNLDRAYPTLYLYKSPTSEMRMMWDLHF
jgi:hypothetical protein